jgi:hypothetical protein
MSNPFITKDAADYIDSLLSEPVRAAVDAKGGVIPMDTVGELTGLLVSNDPERRARGEANHYSRVWLILRRDYLERNEPGLLVNADQLVHESLALAIAEHRETEWRTGKGMPNGERRVLQPIVTELRTALCSWGEISVRLGIPESKVRTAFKGGTHAEPKDKGLRIGKGGRWAYDDPTLYLEHRRVEGAKIPGDLSGRPKPEQLLNYVKEEAKPKPVRKPRAAKAKAS